MSHPRPTHLRRAVLFGSAFVFSLLSCGREPTAPGGASGVRSGAISFAPQFPAGYTQWLAAWQAQQLAHATLGGASPQTSAGDITGYTHVHIVLNNPDGSVAKDTIIDFSPNDADITLSLVVNIPSTAPAAGVNLALNLDYTTPTGQSVFHGTTTITAAPAVPGAPPPPPVSVPITYTGPGAQAVAVAINPKSRTVNTGQTFSFTAQAFDAVGNPVSGAPVFFSVVNPALATITSGGSGTAGNTRGVTQVVAGILSGAQDVASLTIVAPPASIALVSGSGQTANVGANLAQPIIARVLATDGQPASGVTVNFAAATGGGTVTPASAVTDASGNAQATWKLGSTIGSQTATASASGLTGSPVTFGATALALPAVRVVFQVQPPASTAAGSVLAPAIVVQAVDANGAVAPAFTGNISVALGAGAPAGAVLSGTTSIAATAGVATFSDLKLNTPGTYTLVTSAATLLGSTSNSFQIVAGAANRLAFQAYPVNGATAGATFDPITVSVLDALGNPVTTFNGQVTLSAIGPTAAAAESDPQGASANARPASSASHDAAAPAGGTPASVVLSSPVSVAAVNGIATFSNIQLTAAGNYTLSASGAGLTTAIGPSFAIAAGPATNISVASGGGQSAAGGVTLANPVVIKVTDAFGNGIAGKTVSFTPTASSGSVNPTSGVSNSGGFVQTAWTIGTTAGSMTLNVASAGLAPNPLAVTATATSTTGPGPATQLAWTTAPLGGTAGASLGSLVVTAKDANNATATGFTGTVALAITANPCGGALGGTITVAAVAGVATFSSTSIAKACTGYTLTASSGALTTATTLTFNITAAAAANIVADSGNGQGGTAGAALAQAFVARVTDAFGNAVQGTNVAWAVASGGGSLGGTTTSTDVNGRVRTTLTTGSSAGSNTVTATSGTLTGSPLTFSANTAAGAATKVVITTQPSNVTAGIAISPSVVVTAQDANGNTVSSYTAVVTLAIGTNPGGATLGGTFSLNAVAGVATFPNVRLNKTGTGYTLAATSGTLAGATSNAFNVTPAPAIAIVADSGNAQTALASSQLPIVLVSRTVDSLGNAVPGVSVTWGTPTAGGSLSATTTTTDAAGRVRATWTLGATPGPQTVTATSGTLAGSPLTFSATASSTLASFIWTGATNTAWTTATNWSPNGVPAAGDSVLISPSANNPVLSAPVTVKHLTLQGNASLSIGTNNLTVTGNLDAGHTIISGGGVVQLTGTGAFKGKVNGAMSVTGTYAVAATDTVTGDLTIGTGGALTIGANGFIIGGNFATTGTGTLNMSNAASAVSVTGNVGFGGGSETGLLTAGALALSGNFSQTGGATSFAATGTHQVQFNGATQSLSMASPATAPFAQVLFNTGTVTALTDFFGADVQVGLASIQVTGSGVAAHIGASFSDPNARWSVPVTKFIGTVMTMNGSLNNTAVSFLYNTITMQTGAVITGNVTIDSSATLVMNGHPLSISGNFATQNGGRLQMVNAVDTLTLNGNMSFFGAAEVGLITAGVVQFNGNLSNQSISQFWGTGTNKVIFTGASNQLITGPYRFQDATFTGAGGVTFDPTASSQVILGTIAILAPSAAITGHAQVIIGGSITETGAAGRWQVDTVSFGGCNCPEAFPSVMHSLLRGGGNVSLGSSFTVDAMEIYSGLVTWNGHSVVVTGTFKTKGNGALTMTNAVDSLTVGGNADFSGWQSDLTAGTTIFNGNFQQTAAQNGRAFRAQAGHTSVFAANPLQTISFANPDAALNTVCGASCFGNLTVTKSVNPLNFTTAVAIQGNFLENASGEGSVNAASVGKMIVKGSFTAGNSTSVHVSNLTVRGALTMTNFTHIDSLTYAGGPSQTMVDRSFTRVTIRGAPTLTTNLTNTQTLVVDSGSFNAAGHIVTVDTLRTQNTGTLTAASGAPNSSDSIAVNYLAAFGGGTSAPADGKLVVFGDFVTTGAAFQATGNHTTIFARDVSEDAVGQTITGSLPVSQQGLHHVVFDGQSPKKISGKVNFSGDVIITTNSPAITGVGAVVGVGGVLSDATSAFENRRPANGPRLSPQGARARLTPLAPRGSPAFQFNENGGWQVDSTEFFGTSIDADVISTQLAVTGHLVPARSLHVNGNVTVSGAAGNLEFGPTGVTVTGNFTTASGGIITMTDADGYLGVMGNVSFAGGSTTGKITAGYMEFMANFSQGGGAADAFAADPAVEVDLGISDCCASRAPTGGGRFVPLGVRPDASRVVPRTGKLGARRSLELSMLQPGKPVNPAKQAAAKVRANARAAGAKARHTARFAAVARKHANALTSARVAQIRAAAPKLRAARPRLGLAKAAFNELPVGSVVSFANPGSGASHFGYLYLQGSNTLLDSDVDVEDQLATGDNFGFNVSSTSSSDHLITSHGADVRDLFFDNIRWSILDGAPIYGMDVVSFSDMDGSHTQFSISRQGPPAGTCPPEVECFPTPAGHLELFNWTFNTTPGTGLYMAVDALSLTPALYIDMDGVTPAFNGGFVTLAGGAGTNWVDFFKWTGTVDADWHNSANWNTGIVPTFTDDITILASAPHMPVISAISGETPLDGFAHTFTIQSGATVTINGGHNLWVDGDFVAPTASAAVLGSGSLVIEGDGDLHSAIGHVHGEIEVTGNYQVLSGGNLLISDTEIGVENGGTLDINGGEVDAGDRTDPLNAGKFYTATSGVLVMHNSADKLFVGTHGAWFDGGSTSGLLSAGTITLVSSTVDFSCLHVGILDPEGAASDAFSPSGAHKVVVTGPASQPVSFEFFFPNSSFLNDLEITPGSAMSLGTNVLVLGTLSRGTGSGAITIGDPAFSAAFHTLTVGGLNQSGADQMIFNDVGLIFVNGSSNATFSNVKFTGFNEGATGALFTVNRSGSYTFSTLDFSSTGMTLSASAHYLSVNGPEVGSVTVTISSSSPASGSVGTFEFVTSGSATVHWP